MALNPVNAEYQRNRRLQNLEKFKEVSRVSSRRYYARKAENFNKLKDVPCADCGGRFPPCAMDFDHIPERGEKRFQIAGNHCRAPEEIAAEIAKCEVVCANCHRIRTTKRRHVV